MARISNLDEVLVATILDWPDGQKVGPLRCLIGLLHMTAKAGTTNLLVSQRALADAAGLGFSESYGDVNTRTVGRGLRYLERRELVALRVEDRPAERKDAWKARTNITVRLENLPSPADAVEGLHDVPHLLLALRRSTNGAHHAIGLFDVVRHVAWEERKGLGLNALRIWLDLAVNGPETASHLANRLHLGERTIYSWLGSLRGLGLARSERGKWVPLLRSLDEVAADLGLADRKDRRTECHRRGSRNWRSFMRAYGLPQHCPLLAPQCLGTSEVAVLAPRIRYAPVQRQLLECSP